MGLLKEIHDTGVTVLMVTHSLELVGHARPRYGRRYPAGDNQRGGEGLGGQGRTDEIAAARLQGTYGVPGTGGTKKPRQLFSGGFSRDSYLAAGQRNSMVKSRSSFLSVSGKGLPLLMSQPISL